MIKTEQMKDCRVQIVDVDRILDDFVAEIIGDAVSDTAPHATTRQQHSESMGVVVSTILQLLIELDHRSPTKLASTNDEGLAQKASRL
jgi:hypothetical protein